jgi:hypothetical protein
MPEQKKTSSEFKAMVQQQLEEAKQRLTQAKQDLAELNEEDKEAIRKKSAEIQQRIKAQQTRLQGLRDDIAAWIGEKKQQTDEQVMSWRQKRELKHLQKRADRAEEHAVNSVVVAIMDADEAEAAVLDALDARIDAATAAVGS